MKILKKIIVVIELIFAGIGITVVGVFLGMQHGLLNVRGSIIERNAYFGAVPSVNVSSTTPSGEDASATNGCTHGDETTTCAWNETVYFEVVRDALIKDAPVINRVSAETGMPARMIAAAIIPEQIRFFTDNREVFKRYFEPLKLLVSLSKFSLGVSGIKQETAAEIERHLADPQSEFHPDADLGLLVAYPEGADHDTELFNRLTNEKDHYYSYLYTALFLKEIETQWKKAGYDVHARPDVLVTLFNLGFAASHPKADPQVAGAPITIGGQQYSFGHLGALFYHSNELLDTFPR